jgi:hypothetical protein
MTLANIIDLTYIRNATGRQGKIEPSLLELDKGESRRHTVSKMRKRGEDECIMDRQYEYVPVDPSDHNGFLPDHTNDCIDPMAEKRIASLQRE